MTRVTSYALAALLALSLAACASTPEPEVIAETVEVVVPEVVRTCTSISALERVVIPAETKTFYATTEIANPPYEPIQRTEKIERVITPEQVIYVDTEGRQVLDLCDAPEGVATTPEDMDGFDDLGDLQVEQIGGPKTLVDKPMVDLNPNN